MEQQKSGGGAAVCWVVSGRYSEYTLDTVSDQGRVSVLRRIQCEQSIRREAFESERLPSDSERLVHPMDSFSLQIKV